MEAVFQTVGANSNSLSDSGEESDLGLLAWTFYVMQLIRMYFVFGILRAAFGVCGIKVKGAGLRVLGLGLIRVDKGSSSC